MNLFGFNLQSLAFDIMGEIWSWVYCIASIFPKIFYLLCNAFLTIIDFFQFLFRKFAGLEVYYVESANGTLTAQEGDVIYQFLYNIILGDKYPLLSNVFWAMIVLAVILLFISTLVAIIRKDYNYEKDNAKGPIIGSAIKSLAFIAMVPIIVLFGVYLSNTLLKAVDSASNPQRAESFVTLDAEEHLKPYTLENGKQSYIAFNFFGVQIGTSTTPFSSYVFETCAYGANRVRLSENTSITSDGQTFTGGFLDLLQNNYATNFKGMFTGDNAEIVATKIDEAFMGAVTVKDENKQPLNFESSYIAQYNRAIDPFLFLNGSDRVYATFDKANVTLVWYYYDLWSYNIFIAVGAGLLIGLIMFNITIAMLGRIVEMIALFMVYAPTLGLSPLDGNKAFKSWRDAFIKKTVMAFGAVVGLNILFIMLPYLGDIKFFGDFVGAEVANGIVTVLLIFVGLQMVKTFIGIISNFVGGEDANKYGGDVGQELGGNLVKAGLGTAALIGAGTGIAASAFTGGAGLIRGGTGLKRAVSETYKENKQYSREFLGREAGRRYNEKISKQKELEKQFLDQEIDSITNSKLRESADLYTESGKAYKDLTDKEWGFEQETQNYKDLFKKQRDLTLNNSNLMKSIRSDASTKSKNAVVDYMMQQYGKNWAKPKARDVKHGIILGETSYYDTIKKAVAFETQKGVARGYGRAFATDSLNNLWKYATDKTFGSGSGFYKGFADAGGKDWKNFAKESKIPVIGDYASKKLKENDPELKKLKDEVKNRMDAEADYNSKNKK